MRAKPRLTKAEKDGLYVRRRCGRCGSPGYAQQPNPDGDHRPLFTCTQCNHTWTCGLTGGKWANIARHLGIAVEERFADWRGKGLGAGPARNREMLALGPVAVYAFKKSWDATLSTGGTENMARVALEAGVPVHHWDGEIWTTLRSPV